MVTRAQLSTTFKIYPAASNFEPMTNFMFRARLLGKNSVFLFLCMGSVSVVCAPQKSPSCPPGWCLEPNPTPGSKRGDLCRRCDRVAHLATLAGIGPGSVVDELGPWRCPLGCHASKSGHPMCATTTRAHLTGRQLRGASKTSQELKLELIAAATSDAPCLVLEHRSRRPRRVINEQLDTPRSWQAQSEAEAGHRGIVDARQQGVAFNMKGRLRFGNEAQTLLADLQVRSLVFNSQEFVT